MKNFVGTIIEESLEDLSILDELRIISSSVTSDLEWHIHKVEVTKDQIEKLSHSLRIGPWYMHFWSGSDIIVAFKDKIFHIKHGDRATWKPAVDYGLSLDIPPEQLDFPIEN
ncbi:MAG: hypothetical protein Q8Q05_02645 [bacterium]|nr:hypothetical protein [bacterium]